MKAAFFTKYGPPEVVSIKEIAVPQPKPNEVLIKIKATTVNRTDCGFRSAEYVVTRLFSGILAPKINVLGCEFAGEIADIGSQVKEYKTGDKVFGFKEWKFSCHAEYVTMPENGSFSFMPDHFSFEEAAPLTEGSHYALNYLRAAKIGEHSSVLLYGATGAIGSAGVQLCKYFGAKVTAVCRTEKVELIKSLGADQVIDYTIQDCTNTHEKYDLAFDAVGKKSFGEMNKILKPKGVYVSTELGPGGENIFLALFTPLLNGKKLLFPIPVISKKEVEFIRQLANEKKFKPVIDKTYTLENITEAYRYAETGMKTGNLVITL